MSAARRSRPARSATPHPSAPAAAWSLSLGVLAFACYAALAGRVSADKDSSEFTLVLATLGVSHPTGYPLYTTFGHVFGRTLHAVGVGWPQAAALWSALAGATAVGLVHALAAHLLALRGVPGQSAALVALLPAVAFGANPIWTLEATVAEVGAWHLAWVGLATWSALALAAAEARPTPRQALLAGLLVGTGLAHHLSSLFWSAPLGLLFLTRAAHGERRALLVFAGSVVLVPLAGVGFLAWRAAHPAAVQWPLLVNDAAAIWDHVTGAQYRHYLGRFAPSPSQAHLFGAFVLPSLVPALLALLAAGLRPARSGAAHGLHLALLAGGLLQTAFAFSYGVPDPVSYFLPALAVGLAAAPAAVLGTWPALARHGVWAAGVAAVAIALVLPGWVGIARERTRAFERFDVLVRSMWERIPDEPGFVLWADDMSHRLREYQLFGGRGRALVVVDPVVLAHPRARERFQRVHGFDPLAGAALPPLERGRASAAFTDSAALALGRGSPWPVYVFAPDVPSVRRVVKAGARP